MCLVLLHLLPVAFQISWYDSRTVLWAVIKSELLYPKKLVFQSEDIYYSCMQETISLGEKNQKDGAEIIKEREQKAEAKQRKKRKGRSDAFD